MSKSDSVRVRFAPSPTGNVHIGNIRAAIFNWLYARHFKGKFLLRVEDTDRERSTKAAIDTLLECMNWLGLDFDEEVFYQSAQADHHLAMARKLLDFGYAYKTKAKPKEGEVESPGEITVFRIPWNVEDFPCIRFVQDMEVKLHPEHVLRVDQSTLAYAGVSSKGMPIPLEGCLAGFRGLKAYDESGAEVFDLEKSHAAALAGQVFEIKAARMTFKRHAVFFNDLVKGELAKPLDTIKDLTIVRSDDSPIFHLANIVDDITQKITHIVRGDDHVENTYRHVLIFAALGEKVPVYAHLPMIVNKDGKPYSKRDGDAYVGDFRTKGYLPEALFNYLLLLGWAPNDGREKISRADATAIFDLAKVRSTPAQVDLLKLFDLNGQYLAEMPPAEFLELVKPLVEAEPWYNGDEAYLAQVATLMQSRCKLSIHALQWGYFFGDDATPSDEKSIDKIFNKPGLRGQLEGVATQLETCEWSVAGIEAALHAACDAAGLGHGKLNQAVRFATTAAGGGADLTATLVVIGRERSLRRLRANASKFCPA
ncbi:MAG: Glutamate--tRNA ligase [Verrucomicrobiota bacterium]|jgi:glutamyl/glutaminyl-tRNA synthetase